ncbi:MAG: sigma 54-interacting transcriptional regulator [Acidobacteria bacterium]|nr:sigma 54-interacting transcriptional regulator [Acidobacteriota bacterium]
MVATAERRGLSDVLRTMADGIAQCSNVVLARIWLIASGEACSVCRGRAEARDQSRSLHLVASAGGSRDPGADYSRLDGAFHRFAIGERKIGRVAESGEPLLLTGLRGDEEWAADPGWLKREGIRTAAAQPLVFQGDILGVLAMFDRGELDDHALEWLRMFADYAAVSIANARALEEIDVLRAKLEEENLYLREEVTAALGMGDFVGESPALQKVLRQVQLVAPTDASVLITGESGTGKELVARAIHEASTRKGRALIKVNCGAVPDTLFESEFFGHVKGAFTGALTDRPGRFELADRGTLFLDEIGEVPLAMQTKLLRVLQEREFERVGDTRTRKVDVRVIAATNRDLKREVEAGRFRQDLFYRLSVFPVEIPPLRERREDIPRLVQHFVAQSARRLNRPVPRVRQPELTSLAAHDWPGNVRELQNLVERAVIVWQGGPLQFPLEPVARRNATPSTADTSPASPLLTRAELKRLERESISRALEQANGRVSGPGGAAELLGLRPTTLASRIAALGLKRTRAMAPNFL